MTLNNGQKINKIISEFQKGNSKKAILDMEFFLKNNPKNELGRYNYAYMCDQLNIFEIAVENYLEVIKINKLNWKAKFNLYIIYIKQKKYKEALKLVNDVLYIKENYQPALRDKALILFFLEKPDVGLKYILQSIKLNPLDYIALNTLALIYISTKNYILAEKILKKAIKLKSDYAPNYNNLGRVYDLLNKNELAKINYKKSIEINPNFQEAINNIANYYNNKGNYLKAIEYYLKAIKLEKNDEKILFNIGISYINLEKYEIAESYFKKSLKINPNSGKLNQNYGILLLSRQRFKEAWTYYEGRFGLDEFKLKNEHINKVKNKLWDGKKSLSDKKILVIKEQGIGDEILYSSMYNELFTKYKNIKIESDPRLINIFKRSFTNNSFFPFGTFSSSNKTLEKFDIVLYAASLGKVFRNKLSDFHEKKFLIPQKENVDYFSKILNDINSKPKIGISWRSINKVTGSDKSLDLDLFFPLINNKKYTFINMQYGETKKEINLFKKNYKLDILNIDEIDLFNDFDSMASLIKNLDLFISVSSSTAHLAAAVGTETWIIKPKNHVLLHYWNQPKNKTPWYPKVKLFPFKNKWEETLLKIKKELDIKFSN